MANDDSKAKGDPQYVHVHVCIYCGYLLRREEVDGLQVASGIFHCSKCELDGPLNMEIREATEVNVSPSDLHGSESSSQR